MLVNKDEYIDNDEDSLRKYKMS